MKKLVVICALFCSACGTVTPSSGTYLATTTEGSNTCGADFAIETVTDEELKIEVDLDKNLVIIEDNFECDLDGNVAACSEVFDEESGEGYTVLTLMNWELTWSSETKATGSYGMAIECEGEPCSELAAEAGIELPCESSINIEMELK